MTIPLAVTASICVGVVRWREAVPLFGRANTHYYLHACSVAGDRFAPTAVPSRMLAMTLQRFLNRCYLRSDNMLTHQEQLRYSRQILLPDLQREGQQRLKDGSVLVIGAGGLGSPALYYLAAAGVGRIGIVDFDTVEESNLQRQILYCSTDLGNPKATKASERLAATKPLRKN